MTNVPPVVEAVIAEPIAAVVKSGRRQSDVQIVVHAGRSVFFWIFGMFLDERHKPSMSRIMLALWTILGWQLEYHEIRLNPGTPPISNAAWGAWWAAQGMLALAVFGPSIASYFGPGAAGASTAGSIGASLRDELKKVEEKVEERLNKHEG